MSTAVKAGEESVHQANHLLTSNAGLDYRPRGGLSGQIAMGFLAWRERRYTARASDEILALYRTASSNHAELSEIERYRCVVMKRTGCDVKVATEMLACARDSFAQWPVRRELTLCDVVHYLSMTEFLLAHEDESWIHTNLALIIKSRIPKAFCVARQAA
jgi:hypothetical protein